MGLFSESILYGDMLRAADGIQTFDWHSAEPFIKAHREFQGGRGVIINAIGSSETLPANHFRDQARMDSVACDWPVNVFVGMDAKRIWDDPRKREIFKRSILIFNSNSGGTGETLVMAYLLGEGHPAVCAMTAYPESPLAQFAGPDRTVILSCGAEGVVAAAPSVVLQTATLQAFARQDIFKNHDLGEEAGMMREILTNTPVDSVMADTLGNATHIYVCGADDGVADEIAWKFNEIAGVSASPYVGSEIVHGPQVPMNMRSGSVVLLVHPMPEAIRKIEDVVWAQGGDVFAISARKIDFRNAVSSTLVVPVGDPDFAAYPTLTGGWLAAGMAAQAKNKNPDHANGARKIAMHLAELTH